jgi:hypothetical protein
LGGGKYRIETIARAANGSIALPKDKADVAFWVEGTNAHYVFVLSPTDTNLALKTTLKSGDPATITWGDCSSEAFTISKVENGSTTDAKLFDQSASGITLLIQPEASAQGIVITAGRTNVQAARTPEPTQVNAIQAELSFLGNKASPDGKSLVMNIALKNTGTKSITLTGKDVSLTAGDAAPQAPVSVEPALPQEIAPGVSQTFQITFAKPAGNTAIFKLLTFSADVHF